MAAPAEQMGNKSGMSSSVGGSFYCQLGTGHAMLPWPNARCASKLVLVRVQKTNYLQCMPHATCRILHWHCIDVARGEAVVICLGPLGCARRL